MSATTSDKGLPEMAGICTLAEAMVPGVAVADCVDRLKRYHYALRRLWNIFQARLTSEPVYELKMAFSHHAYLCSEHATAMRNRVAEMRHPPLGLEDVPHAGLEVFFDEIRAAPSTWLLLDGVYSRALPTILDAMEGHLAETNPLADYPTVRALRQALAELDAMKRWGETALDCLAEEAPADENQWAEWSALLDACLASAGGINGPGSAEVPVPERIHSRKPFRYHGTPRRDGRFPDPYNMGVHAEEFLYHPEYPADAKALMMYYKRLREIDVPEMMAGILCEMTGKPWEFYRAMTRQLWDEARHAMMGETGFRSLGIDWPRLVMVNFTWSKGLNEQLTPRERHAVLWFIEQGLMGKTGKRYEWEVGRDSGDSLALLFQDYDWADEVLHARIGRDWYVSEFESLQAASGYGSECWNRVVSDWAQWREDGLTAHRNWWPDLYREYCRLHEKTPDPAALAFSTTYEETRADLKRVSASG